MSDVKPNLFKTQILKHDNWIDLIDRLILVMQLSTYQFLIGRARGEGGQVAFLRTSPK